MKKILNIITDTNIGGAGNVLLNFMAKTDRTEFAHTVITPENAQLTPLLRELGVCVTEMKGIADKSLSISAVDMFRREFKRLNPDLIHTHASLSARIAARMWDKNCPLVYTRHCAYPQSRLKKTFPVKQVMGFVNNRLADIIIAISPAARDNLVETGTNQKKIVTMFNGVEPVRKLDENEKKAIKASLGIKEGMLVCAAVARLVPEKGHLYILEAAGILRDLPICFVIAGSGPYEIELRAAAAGLDLKNCVFTGFVGDIATIENIADLQLNAAYGTETSSLSLLEGMSLSVPAVVSDFGGNPFLIENGRNGLVVPQRDGTALAAAVRKLFEDTEMLSEMGDAALQIYNTRFTAAVMTANIENVYRTALGNR